MKTVAITIFLATVLAMAALIPAASTASAFQYKTYKGEFDSFGLIVTGDDYPIVLDENSKLTVSGSSGSSEDVGAGGSEVPVVGNEETSSEGNETGGVSNETEVIEVPHIGNTTIDFGSYNGTGSNITSSTDVINEVVGNNVTEIEVIGGSDNSTTEEVIDTGNQTSVQEEINEIVNEGLGCLSGDELRKLIQLLSLFSY